MRQEPHIQCSNHTCRPCHSCVRSLIRCYTGVQCGGITAHGRQSLMDESKSTRASGIR